MIKYCIKTMYTPSKIPLTAFLMQLNTTFSKKHNTVNYLSEKRRKYYQYQIRNKTADSKGKNIFCIPIHSLIRKL